MIYYNDSFLDDIIIYLVLLLRTGDSRQRQRLLCHEHLGELRLPPAGAWLCGPGGPAAQPMQLHTPSSAAPLQPVNQTQQSGSLTPPTHVGC